MRPMKQHLLLMAACCVFALVGGMASDALALDAFFDTQISTNLEYTPNSGSLVVKMIDEDLPPILPDVSYQRAILVEILFDASSTMGETDMNGIRKIEIAKKLVQILLKYFPQQDTQFALRVSGGKTANNCLDSELVVPFSEGNGQNILDAVQQIQPKGLSPLGFSIREMLKDFAGHAGSRIVFVVTDGDDTCDSELADSCTTTMDMLVDAGFGGNLNILGINTIYNEPKNFLKCLSARGNGEFLDSNRDSGQKLGQLIYTSSQLRYSIARILDAKTLSEGNILGLFNRRIGEATELNKDTSTENQTQVNTVQPGIITKQQSELDIQEIRVENLPPTNGNYSTHELPPGVYKIEFLTTPPLTTYFTIDQGQQFTIGIVRSGSGFDLFDRAHLAIGNRYYDNGQYQEALAEYQKVLEFDNKNVDAHLNMGVIYQDILQDKDQASLHYRTYMELQGPRLEEVSKWFREVQGLPSEEDILQQKLLERDEEKAREEAEKLAAAEEERLKKEEQKAINAYKEVLTANPNIRTVSQQEILARSPKIEVIVSSATTVTRAEKLAVDVGTRLKTLLNYTPDVYIYRETDPNTLIQKATYDAAQQIYVPSAE